LDQWATKCLSDDLQKWILFVDVLLRLSRFDRAKAVLHKIRQRLDGSHPRAWNLVWMMSKAEVRAGNPRKGQQWAAEAQDLLPSNARPEARTAVQHQLAFASYRAGDSDGALEKYQSLLAEEDLSHQWRGVLLHDAALIHQDRGLFRKADLMYQQSIESSTESGDLNHVAWSLFQRGVCAFFENPKLSLS
jgi:tetratricopeptide (TPR) repeat protein